MLYWRLQTTLSEFAKPDFSVVRQHEEFVWLHDRYEENDDYAGIVVSLLLVNIINFLDNPENKIKSYLS